MLPLSDQPGEQAYTDLRPPFPGVRQQRKAAVQISIWQ